MNPYEVLGVPPTATAEEVKAAYRTRAQATHPDKPGGSEEEFKAVGAAFTLLADPAARSRYDEFGDASPGLTVAQEAEQVLASIFEQFLEANVQEPPLQSMRGAMKGAEDEQKKELGKAKRTRDKTAKLLKALKRKVPGPSTLTDVLVAQQKRADQKVALITRQLAVIAQVLLSIDQWEDSTPAPSTPKGLQDYANAAQNPVTQESLNRVFNSFFGKGWNQS